MCTAGALFPKTGGWIQRVLLVIAIAVAAAADLIDNVVPVWGGMNVDNNFSRLSRELMQVASDTRWERNGQVFRSGSRPDDAKLWTNRFQLYDKYGRWTVDPAYQPPPPPKSREFARQLLKKQDLKDLPDGRAINKDFEANFWFGQSLPDDGYAWSLPKRPWIRQSVPYTCDTNPFDECPVVDKTDREKDRKKCIDDKCPYGKRVGKPIITPDGGEYQGTVMVAIEVTGARMFPSKHPSKPNVPFTSFQNGVCERKCANKPVFPSCLDQLTPWRAVYGSGITSLFEPVV